MEHTSESERSASAPDIRLRPVGIVRSVLKQPSLVPKRGDLHWGAGAERAREERDAIAELVVDDDLTGILDGIDGFSHLLVLYWAHLVPQQARSMTKVHPMGRKDLPLTGIFATCSPARPNPISVTVVRLLERRGNVLVVEGLEAVDGSPVIDIKPYTPYYYRVRDVQVSEWMAQVQRGLGGRPPRSGPAHGKE
ncbi:MAG: tRNA (N6-threonylcarbamoyladenosine(37)-N6)-methyltransferase TrmO [Chloroflexota bacterium]|nr:tRNA (N6-threonylcarbamoyladenosine(37)-N6)-methyltransferase TrmO [Chloroflexota bacterium]